MPTLQKFNVGNVGTVFAGQKVCQQDKHYKIVMLAKLAQELHKTDVGKTQQTRTNSEVKKQQKNDPSGENTTDTTDSF
jgi:hypothetical protein